MNSPALTLNARANPTERLDVLVIGESRRSVGILRVQLEADLPQANHTFVVSPNKFKLPPGNTGRQLILIEFRALGENAPEFLANIRDQAPDAWITLIVDPTRIAEVVDRLGLYIDSIVNEGADISGELQQTYTLFNAESNPPLSRPHFADVSTISLLAVSDYLHDVVALADGEGMLVYTNGNWRDIFSSSAEGKSYLSDSIHPNDIHRLEAELQLAIIENTSGKAIIRIKSKAETWETLQVNITGMEVEGIKLACICGRNVSELHRLQNHIQTLERQNHLFITQIEDVVYRFDPWRNRIQYVSPSCLRLTGYTEEEWIETPSFITTKIFPNIALERESQSASSRHEALRGTESFVCDLFRKDGTTAKVWRQETFEWSRDGKHYWINGRIKEFSTPGLVEDPTEGLNQWRIAESEHTLLLENLREGIIDFDLTTDERTHKTDLQCVSCNSAFEGMVGLSRNKIVGSRFLDLFPGLDETPLDIESENSLPQWICEVEAGREAASITDFYWPHLRSYFNVIAIPKERGRITLAISDETRRRHAEIRLDALLRGLPDVALYQTGGGVEYISEGIANMLGYVSDDFQKNRELFTSLIHPEDRLKMRDLQHKWMRSGSQGVLEMEFRAKHKRGQYIWILDRMSKAFTTPDGRQSSQGVMIDITARKVQEQERLRRAEVMDTTSSPNPDLFVIFDHRGAIIKQRAANPDILGTLGIEWKNGSLFEVLPRQLSEQIQAGVSRLNGLGSTSLFRTSLNSADGQLLIETRLIQIADRQSIASIRKINEPSSKRGSKK
jgi:PAS domain S-box-containing protein